MGKRSLREDLISNGIEGKGVHVKPFKIHRMIVSGKIRPGKLSAVLPTGGKCVSRIIVRGQY